MTSETASKRIALLARAQRTGRMDIASIMCWGIEMGFDTEQCAELFRRISLSEPGETPEDKLISALVRGYGEGSLHLDEVYAWALDLGLENCMDAILDACGEVDLRREQKSVGRRAA